MTKIIPCIRSMGKRFYDADAPPWMAAADDLKYGAIRIRYSSCRNLLGCQKYRSKLWDMEMPGISEHLYDIKIYVCRECDGHLQRP